MKTSGPGAASPPRDPWPSHARQWSLLRSPLRPCGEDVEIAVREARAWSEAHASKAPRALLLGVTPELATMDWPAGTSLVAADRSEPMIESVFPKEGLPGGARAVCADWRSLPLAGGSIDVVVGDGCFSVFAFPDEVRAFAREVRRVTVSDARLVMRVFAAPDAPESLDAIAQDLRGGKIGSFHVLKWRLAMAVQPSPERGAVLREVHAACADLAEILEDLADKPGFEPEVTRTIEAYRGSGIKYTFPTVSLLKEALAETFEVTATFTKSYELGERCPTLVLRRR